jgi:transcriptional regulator with XRE-family HTH domain
MSGSVAARVAAEVRAEMGRQNISRRELAHRIGQPVTTVSRWVKGETDPGLDDWEAIARALGVSVVDLVSRASDRASVPAADRPDRVPRRRSVDPLFSSGR